ncbi:MAG: hypothetical protein HQ518_20790 [Rhodopirellula sp.]|nr:hypothetical protein [Rhodopirellula sp.]
MFKAMLKKEVTELAAPFLLAVTGLVTLVVNGVFDRRNLPKGEWMLDADFAYPFLMLSLCLAVVMGLVQSLSEDVQGTWRYVLAMPGGWRRIVKLKFACGAAVWLAWSLISIVICQLGIMADNGPQGEPFGRLSEPMLRTLVCVPVVYLGAFLTALRRVNWFFSRLMPLAGVMMCWFILLYLPNWWVLAPLATAGLAAVLVGLVFHVAASRDFA